MVAARLLPADASERQRIDRYELVGEIASGGMATVYLARRAGVGGFQRFVAVKRLHPHLATEAEFVQMFLDEARISALIHHPNVVSISEVGASDRGYYLVMDYIEGDTLARLMTDCAEAGRVVPLGVGLRIVLDTLTGLHAAHDQHDEHGNPTCLVHRDVSPQNVLVGLDGISRISDFGVARAATRLAGTRVGQLKGKIAYMAPEQAAGDELLDRRADVFAAGIVLWELLTGRRLFRASNDAATLSRVVTERIEPPIHFVEGLDARISDVCMKALERTLSKRIGSAAQFAEMLESAATRSGVLATGRDVGAYMLTAMGDEVTRQREAIRKWVAERDNGEESSGTQSARRTEFGPSWQHRGGSDSDQLPSSTRGRPAMTRTPHDGNPEDVTVVAPRRRSRWVNGGVFGVLLGLGGLGWTLGRPHAHSAMAETWLPMSEGAPSCIRVAMSRLTPVRPIYPTSAFAGFGDGRSHDDGLDQNQKLNAAPGAAKGGVSGRASIKGPRSLERRTPTDVDLTNPYTH